MFARQKGIVIGQLPTGPKNNLCDINGVQVGHFTLSDGPVQTGVTAILPACGNLFEQKCVAASHVINGFGKSIGLLQVNELGQLETPILLTNTLSVGTASSALVRHMLDENPAIGESTGTVNPVVMECNDGGYLNDIRGLHVKEDHVRQALAGTADSFEQGAIGAGRGMKCYGLKGGIGSASRQVMIGETSFTIALLVLCNMGRLPDLVVDGLKVGDELAPILDEEARQASEKGSIIMILGSDAPLSNRQLRRLCVRAGAGLARTGTHFGSGSGDVVLGFSTANRISHYAPEKGLQPFDLVHENCLDLLFRAVIETSEEAILNALFSAESVEGKQGRICKSLSDYWPLVTSRLDFPSP